MTHSAGGSVQDAALFTVEMCDHTLEQVVVFPLPCSPTNMMTLFFPLVGVQAFTPGSTS